MATVDLRVVSSSLRNQESPAAPDHQPTRKKATWSAISQCYARTKSAKAT